MNRKNFISKSAMFCSGAMVSPNIIIKGKSLPTHGTIGHGTHQYKIKHDRGVQDPAKIQVNDCHEMIQDSQGRLYQTVQLLKHPHDVCIVVDKNLYIPQWNSGKTYPVKLERI